MAVKPKANQPSVSNDWGLFHEKTFGKPIDEA